MVGKRQFSLAYLFLETFWVALGLGFGMAAYRTPIDIPHAEGWQLVLGIASAVCLGTAIGGVFRSMTFGFCISYVLVIGGVIAVLVVGELRA